jgi:DNA-binding response OmpR family regulator
VSVSAKKSTEPKATVLLVEDEAELAVVLKAVLLGGGYRVVLSRTGDEALQAARRHRLDLIVLDQRLPDVEGLKLLEIFRHDPDTRQARVLMTSGLELRNEALQRGAAGFLLKPVTKDKLLAAVDAAMALRGRGRGRILVVDDDPNIAAVCAEVLVNQGFEVDRAGTLADAKLLVNDKRPDLLLLDVMLPDGDGLSFFESLKAERAASPLSVVFISARADTSAKVRALKLGGDDYLTKPFDALELGARVESVLQRRSSEAQSSPTTHLPGSQAIEREVQRRVAERKPFAFCYLDLDNLKAYNDYYGFAKADGVVRQTGDLLREIFGRHGKDEDFLGHVAGDDFVFMTTPDSVDELCLRLIDGFDRIIPLYYDRADRDRGFIEGADRFGEHRKFPIMTVSIVAVLSDGTDSHAELARHAAELKLKAKAIRGSVFLRSDRSEPVRLQAQGA